MDTLKEEREYFAQSVGDLFKLYPGKVALIKGRQLIGVFDNEVNALAEGAKRFAREPYLVRGIQLQGQDVSAPAYTLGILRADTQHNIEWRRANS